MNLADIFMKEDKDVAHFESVRDQMVMPRESFRLPIKAKSWGVLERRLDDPNYDSLTQSTKRKEQKEMNDVSVVDSKVRIKDNSTVQSNDTNNDTDNDTSSVKWSNHAQQRITYGDGDDTSETLTLTYGDGDDTIDISETITSVIQPDEYQGSSVKQPYIYKSYKDACDGSPITYGRDTITHHENPTNSGQVTSE